MRRSRFCFTFRFAVLGAALFVSPMMMASDRLAPQPDPDTLTALTAYYGVSEEQVIERLAHEAEAARLYSQLPELLGEAYAGAWFDEESFKLKVGLTNPEQISMVERLGATTVVFERSLDELETIQRQIENARADNPEAFAGLVSLGVDYPSNQLALGVLSDTQPSIANALDGLSVEPADYRFHEIAEIPQLSSQIRGADCFENPTFTASPQQTGPYECSIGFAVDAGFITAGHCGEETHNIDSCGGVPMGTVEGSTWHSQPPGSRIQDSGWVETVSPWQPVALVNGYANGVLSITAEAGGFRESPTFSTVCRYGQTSGGPHCGQVLARNQTQQICGGLNVFGGCAFYEYIQGTTETNVCVMPGDSGGSYLSATGHAQGTTIGGLNGTCPVASTSYFQPTADTLNTYSSLNLLTSHGANSPIITMFKCPDAGNSGGGQYLCQMNYDTQGTTTIQWTSNTGHGSGGEILFGSCGPSSTVSVSLTVTNPWGSTHRSANFPCPSGPLP